MGVILELGIERDDNAVTVGAQYQATSNIRLFNDPGFALTILIIFLFYFAYTK